MDEIVIEFLYFWSNFFRVNEEPTAIFFTSNMWVCRYLEVIPKPKLLFRLLSCSSSNYSLAAKVTSSLCNHLQAKTWFILFSCEHKTQLHSFRFSINLLLVIWVNTLHNSFCFSWLRWYFVPSGNMFLSSWLL